MGMVTEIDLAAGEMMKRLIEVTCLPMDKIIFTGTKGLLLTAGADGYAAVIATTWHGCGGCRTLCQEPLVAH
jgi:hypothetical protein